MSEIVSCIILVWSTGGYREARAVEGRLMNTAGEYLIVDFERGLRSLNHDTRYANYVRRVPENDCLYIK